MNNVYSELPAWMQDGRAFSDYKTPSKINDQLRKRAHIVTNSDYRDYLQTHGRAIMDYNRTEACQETGCPATYLIQPTYQPTDLESVYLSRQQLQERAFVRIT